MNVVINKCFGGFGVSPACLWELIQRKSVGVDSGTLDSYFGADNPGWADRWEKQKADSLSRARDWAARHPDSFEAVFRRTLPDGWIVNTFGSVLFDVGGGRYYSYDRNARTDADLVFLIESRGSDWASGPHAKLKVVEIPDGVEWEINEYDGIEHIAQKHQTWA